MKNGFAQTNESVDEWSCEINVGESDGVRTNYNDFCNFAQRVPPGFPMYIEHAIMGGMDVLAIIYPVHNEDGGFPDHYSHQTITKWMNRKGSFIASFGFSHSHYSGTDKLREYCKRIEKVINSKYILGY